MDTAARFGVWDYVVFGAMLLVSAAIGVYYACSGGKQKTTGEFLMGDRSLSVFPVAMSVLASFLSAVGLLGTPAEMYLYGTQFYMVVAAQVLVAPVAAYLYVPVFYGLRLTSAYEYLERRFDRFARVLACITFALHMTLYMGICLYAPALALSQVTGMSLWFSVLSIGLVCTFYTTIGGMKAVVWTDLFQALMMFLSSIVILAKGMLDAGGWSRVWQTNLDGGRIEFFNMNPDPTVRTTFWTTVLGGFFGKLALYATSQPLVQRYMTVPSLRKAQATIWINVPSLILIVTLTCLTGMVIYTQYHSCDPIITRQVEAPDQLFPLFVMDTLGAYPGLPGLFVSGIFSGSLSTISSGVNSLVAVTLEDFVKPKKPDLSEVAATRLSKILALVFGAISILLVALAEKLGNVLQSSIGIFGILGGPILGLFTLGMFVPWASAAGARVGFVVGLIFSLWVGIGSFVYKPYIPKSRLSVDGCPVDAWRNLTIPSQQLLKEQNQEIFVLYRLSYFVFSPLGCFTTIIVGMIVSLILGRNDPASVDPELITPPMKRFCQRSPGKPHQADAPEPQATETRDGQINMGYVASAEDKQVVRTVSNGKNQLTNGVTRL